MINIVLLVIMTTFVVDVVFLWCLLKLVEIAYKQAEKKDRETTIYRIVEKSGVEKMNEEKEKEKEEVISYLSLEKGKEEEVVVVEEEEEGVSLFGDDYILWEEDRPQNK
jgi:biopolymer transport protein ExbD